VEIRPQERQMAESLVASMAGHFDPEEFTDDYRAALQEVIDAKIEGREVVEADEVQPSSGTVVDLMSALRASVEAAKKGRGETSAPAKKAAATKPAATKTTAKTAPAKKAAAKKAPAKKAAAKAPAKKAAARKTPAKKAQERRSA
jgi:DNA end-binding protein Ku